MFKRTLLGIASAAALAGVVVPAIASSGLGFDPWYVENPYGREVPQSGRSAATAFGFDPWYVPGQYDFKRTAMASSTTTRERTAIRATWGGGQQVGHAYADPAFGPQADA